MCPQAFLAPAFEFLSTLLILKLPKAMSHPSKRPRRTSSQAAAVGSADIRAALLRGSQRLATPHDVTDEQATVLVEWGREPLKLAAAAWKECPEDASPLLLAANLALIPQTVLRAFGLVDQDQDQEQYAQPGLIDVERIKACVQRAAAWVASQERAYTNVVA